MLVFHHGTTQKRRKVSSASWRISVTERLYNSGANDQRQETTLTAQFHKGMHTTPKRPAPAIALHTLRMFIVACTDCKSESCEISRNQNSARINALNVLCQDTKPYYKVVIRFKCGAKLLLFFHFSKYFHKKMQKKCNLGKKPAACFASGAPSN